MRKIGKGREEGRMTILIERNSPEERECGLKGLQGRAKDVQRKRGWMERWREGEPGGSSNGSSLVVFHLRLQFAVTARGFSLPPQRSQPKPEW